MRIGGLLKKAFLLHGQNINEKLKEYDLTMSQLDVLILVSLANEKKQLNNQRDIEKKLDLTNPTVTGLINRLEAKGLIERHECLQDRRIKYLYVSGKANQINDDMKRIFSQSDTIALKGFNEDEKRELKNYLLRMIENLKKGE